MRIRGMLASAMSVLLLAVVLPASALDLAEAKSLGLVGETASGYIAAVQPSADVDALVQDINQRRKEQYMKIAERNGITLEAVEVRAGQKALQKTPAGEFVNRGSGWEKQP
jgi:uncharacterized protein YdbL (DUF1318 family)